MRRGRAAVVFRRWASLVARHPGRFTAVGVLATVALAAGLPRLRFDSSQDTMVSPSSDAYLDNLDYQESFGGEIMLVLFEGDIDQLFTEANLAELTDLEADLAATGWFQAVVGPDTGLEFGRRQVDIADELLLGVLDRQLAEASTQEERDRVSADFTARTASDAARLADAGEASLTNPDFVEFLLYDERGEIRASQSGQFPDDRHALLVARLAGNLTLDEQSAAVDDMEAVVGAHRFDGFTTMTTGSAALVKEINDRMQTDMARTGALGVVAMVVVLLLVFRARSRLLALPVVALSMVWAFGAFGYLDIPLTMVTISGLPILFGLGVDFAVQVHARYEEEAARARSPLQPALEGVGPALLVALVAGAVGFLALRISPVPMVREFAVMLAVGVGVLLVAVLALVPLALVWRDRRRGPVRLPAARRHGVEHVVRSVTDASRAHPLLVATAALAITVAGFAVQGRIPVESDPQRFVATTSPVLRDLHHLEDVAGTSSDLGFLVEADDPMRADVLAWMAAYEARQIERYPGMLLQANSIASITMQLTGATPTPDEVRTVMRVAPADLLRTFQDLDAGRVQMLFSVGRFSLAEQEELLDGMQADIDAPPGVTVRPAGLAVVGMEAVRSLEQGRTAMTVAALGAVALWLLLWFRSARTTLLALLPVVTAVGASSLAVYGLGITVSTLGALANPLVIAVCAEFSVLLLERFGEERQHDRAVDAAIDTAALSIGRAFTASGLTIAGGFGVLAISGFPLLSSFGALVAVNVVVAMLCALLILPPLLRRLERRPVSVVEVRPGARAA
jgi:hydrophobe/amphiphile efflux-3 (HAE3) family protein